MLLPGGGTATYRYDGLGRRFEKVVNGVVTRYVHDGANIVIEQDAAGSVAARYTYGALVDQPLVQTRSGADHFYLADHLGSIRALTDATGATVNHYTYDAYGQALTSVEGIANPFTYTAREQDAETGLLHYRARTYSPQQGRFTSQDPIGFAGGDVNFYAYVGNDPANLTDPSGLITPWDAIDIVFFLISLNDFIECPGFATGFNLVVDTIGVAPVIPSPSIFTHAGDIADGIVDAVNAADNLLDSANGIENAAGVAASGTPRGLFLPDEYYNARPKAPGQSAPYSRHDRFDQDGNLKQVTTYDEFGDRSRQFELGQQVRHGEGYHTFTYDAAAPRHAPGGGRRSRHLNFDEIP